MYGDIAQLGMNCKRLHIVNASEGSECFRMHMSSGSKLSMLLDERRAQRHVWPNRLVGQMGFILLLVVVVVVVVLLLMCGPTGLWGRWADSGHSESGLLQLLYHIATDSCSYFTV